MIRKLRQCILLLAFSVYVSGQQIASLRVQGVVLDKSGRAVENLGISTDHGGYGATNGVGHFELYLPEDVKAGSPLRLLLDTDKWRITTPQDGYLNAPNGPDNPINIRVEALSAAATTHTTHLAGSAVDQVVRDFASILEHGSAGDRVVALRALGTFGKRAYVVAPRIAPLLQSSDNVVASVAAETLGRIGNTSEPVLLHLRIALDDDERPQVQEAVARALRQIGPDASSLVPSLLVQVRRADPTPRESFVALALLSIAPAYTAEASTVVSQRIRVVNWREESSSAGEGVALCSLVARGTMSRFYSDVIHGISISTEAVRQECRKEFSRLGTAILPALTEEVRSAELPNAAALFALLHDVAPGCPGEPVDSFLKRLDQLDDKYWEDHESTLVGAADALADFCKERNLEMLRTVLNHSNLRQSGLERLVQKTTPELTEVANTGSQSNAIKALYLLVAYAPSRPPNEWMLAKLRPFVTLSSPTSQKDRAVAFNIIGTLGHAAELLRPELEQLIILLATSADDVNSGFEEAVDAFMATGPATAAIAALMPRLLGKGGMAAFILPIPRYTTLPITVLLSVPQLTDDEVGALAGFAIGYIANPVRRPGFGQYLHLPLYVGAVLTLLSKKYPNHPQAAYIAALYLASQLSG